MALTHVAMGVMGQCDKIESSDKIHTVYLSKTKFFFFSSGQQFMQKYLPNPE